MVRILAAQQSFRHYPDAVLDQDNPVSGTWYTILDTAYKVWVKVATAKVTWTVDVTKLDIRVTIDGDSIIHTFNAPLTDTDYAAVENVTSCGLGCASQILIAIYDAANHAVQYRGKSVKVEARTTGGTTSKLVGRVKYAKKE